MRPLGQEDPLERKRQPAPALVLGNPDRGGWQVTVRGVPELGTTEHAHTHRHCKAWSRVEGEFSVGGEQG